LSKNNEINFCSARLMDVYHDLTQCAMTRMVDKFCSKTTQSNMTIAYNIKGKQEGIWSESRELIRIDLFSFWSQVINFLLLPTARDLNFAVFCICGGYLCVTWQMDLLNSFWLALQAEIYAREKEFTNWNLITKLRKIFLSEVF
jgi:hypothetical protein